MIFDREAITEEFAFGRCRRCGRPPDGVLFADHIFWALCSQCQTAWWAMFSYDGWDKSVVETREYVAAGLGWDIGDEEEVSARAGWDFGEERRDAYIKGTTGEGAFCLRYGLPWRRDDLSQVYRAPDGTPIHVRTSRFDKAALALRPDGDDDGDINVLILALESNFFEAVGWWGGPPSPFGRRPQLKPMDTFPRNSRD